MIRESLQKIKEQDMNMRLSTSTFNKDVVGLASEINEVLDMQKDINIENEQMNREIMQGITNILHDLRTPLTSAIGYIGLIRSDKINEQKKQEYLAIVESRLMFLSNLMSELFDNMQMVDGKVESEFETIDLCHLVRMEISSFYDELAKENFEVSMDIPDISIPLVTVPAQLQRVIQNLMGNVLKHGTDQLLVKISADGVMTFANKVPDNENLEVERLFERYYTPKATRNSKSSGLGLAITKALVEKMGGEVNATLDDDMLSITVNMKKKN